MDGCGLNSLAWNQWIGVASSSGKTSLWDFKNFNRGPVVVFEDR